MDQHKAFYDIVMADQINSYINTESQEERRRRLDRINENGKRRRNLHPQEESLVSKKYTVVLSDNPWPYDFSKSKSRKIENKYPTMTVEEMIDLKHRIPFADNCVLYLWATNPKLEMALSVMSGWGFTYKTNIAWDKKRVGMGYWARGRHELLLIGTRGKKRPPKPKDRPQSVIEEVRSNTHSRKPIKAYEIIEKAFPNDKKLELFARMTREGWDSWGNQAPQSIQLDAKESTKNSVIECQKISNGEQQPVLEMRLTTLLDTNVNSSSMDLKEQDQTV